MTCLWQAQCTFSSSTANCAAAAQAPGSGLLSAQPLCMPSRTLIQLCALAEGSGSKQYTYSSKDSPFSFTVNRAGANSGPAVFDTTGQRLVFKVCPASGSVHDGPALL